MTSFSIIIAQETIDGNFPFQNDPAKKYSIYIPSSYDENVPNKTILGFHPFNTNRWDAQSWRDTLIVFAETNDLILVCPDGGLDGRVDDPIDISFTTALLDSLDNWYNVDQSNKYIIGFSWGGRATYTYGLNNADEFQGFIPIGAAINGINEVAGGLQFAENEKFYIVHGSADSPSVRFTPVRDALINSNACVETNFLNGVGHTIDFPNRNNILSEAFAWVSNPANCQVNNNSNLNEPSSKVSISSDTFRSRALLLIHFDERLELEDITFTNVNGQTTMMEFDQHGVVFTDNMHGGIYFVKVKFTNGKYGFTKAFLP